jgi:hypothetical protein
MIRADLLQLICRTRGHPDVEVEQVLRELLAIDQYQTSCTTSGPSRCLPRPQASIPMALQRSRLTYVLPGLAPVGWATMSKLRRFHCRVRGMSGRSRSRRLPASAIRGLLPGRPGEVALALRAEAEGRISLVVRDTEVGVPNGFDVH